MRSTTTSSRTRRSAEAGGATSGTHARRPGQPARAGFNAPAARTDATPHSPTPDRRSSARPRQLHSKPPSRQHAPDAAARATRRLRGTARAGLGTSTARPRTHRKRRRHPPVAKPRRTNPTVRSTPSGRPVRVNTPRTGAVRNQAARYRREETDSTTRTRRAAVHSGTSHAVSILYAHGGQPIDACGRAQRHAPGMGARLVTLASRHGWPRSSRPAGCRPVAGRGAIRTVCRRSCCGSVRHEALPRAHASGSRRREAPPPRERGASAAYESRTPRRGEPDAHRVGPRPRGLRAEG